MPCCAPSPADRHPRLDQLIARARHRAAQRTAAPTVGVVFAADRLAIEAAAHMAAAALARPLLLGPPEAIVRAAGDAQIDISDIEIIDTGAHANDAASRAVEMARAGKLSALMKGALHTEELMPAIVHRSHGLRDGTRISHAFVFDLPRYPKLLALADCVVNIAPSLRAKQDILSNALVLLRALGIHRPKVGIVAAVETVNPAIVATVDAQALVALARQGAWPGATVEGPLGFDNAISAEAARIKGITSSVAGDADLLLMSDLNAGNMLYKSFNYIGGGECAGLVLGAKVPVVLTSRADSALARLASVALAVLAMP